MSMIGQSQKQTYIMNKQTSKPLVSVVLPMYNAEKTIAECLDSIIGQTYTNMEIIVMDDGSTDNSVEVVKSYADKRIKIFRYKHNYIVNLNRGFLHCNGKYLARMDADDRMCPTRIEKQVEVLENHHNVSVCCSVMKKYGCTEDVRYGCDGIIPNLKIRLLRGNCLAHPTMMFRKTLIQEGFRYKKAYIYAEDYKLWVDMALKDVVFYNIPEALVEYRKSKTQVSYLYNGQQRMNAWLIRQELLETLIKQCPVPLRNKLRKVYTGLLDLNHEGVVAPKGFYDIFFNIFQQIAARNNDM